MIGGRGVGRFPVVKLVLRIRIEGQPGHQEGLVHCDESRLLFGAVPGVMMRFKFLSCFLCLMAVTGTCFSQAGSKASQDKPQTKSEAPNTEAAKKEAAKTDAAKANAPKTLADYPDEPYVVEWKRGHIRFENDGTGTIITEARIHLQSQLGLTKVGQLVFPYNAENEDLEIRSVRVTKPDGKAVTAGPEAVQDLSAPVARQAPMYTDAREKHVSVPGLAVGDILEYVTVKKVSRPLVPGQFWENWLLIGDAICLDEEVEVNGPKGRTLKMKAPSDATLSTHEDGDRTIYTWKTATLARPTGVNPFANLKKFDIEMILKAMTPRQGRRILFSTFENWEAVASWYEGLERDRRIPSAEVKAEADEIVKGKSTDLEKAQALYEWVGRNVRYVSLSFGVGRYQPHAASEVLSNRYGDCKDKTTLLEAFLEAEGMRSSPALVNATAEVDSAVPSPLQFDHLITYLPLASHVYWLDPTSGVEPFGYLLPQLRGENALVVSNNGTGGLQKTRAEMDVPTIYRVEVKGSVDAEGKVDADIGFATRGDLEVLLRLAYTRITPAMMQNIVTQAMQQQGSMKKNQIVSLTNFRADDPTAIADPFKFQIHFAKETGLTVDPKATPLEEAQKAVKGILEENTLSKLLPDSKGPASKGSTEWIPVELGGPKEYSLELNFDVPSLKSAPAEKPISSHLVKDFAEYESVMRAEKGNFYGKWQLNLRVPEVPGSEGKEYAAFCQQVAESLKIVTGDSNASKASPATTATTTTANPGGVSGITQPSGHLPIPEAAALGKEAETEISRQNWAHAAQLLESAVKLDPQYAWAWGSLGRCRMNLGKFADAEIAFRKYVELEPDKRWGYSSLGWSLTAQKRFAQEVEVMEKRVAHEPTDSDANLRLGFSYLQLHQPEKALPPLEKAADLLTNSPWPHFYSGQAYKALKQNDKSASEFERAVAIDNRAGMLNDSAYELSLTGTHLDMAEVWSTNSIHAVETEINQVTTTTIQPHTVQLINALSPYWDTLGWIKFQRRQLDEAEKYIRAAWELADYTTIGYHLARIYEAQGRKTEAEEMYAEALAVIAPGDNSEEDQPEARRRLAALLESEALVDGRVRDSKSRVSAKRPISIPNSARISGADQYLLILGPDAKTRELRAVNPENPLAPAEEALRGVPLRPVFPDKTLEKLPRIGILTFPNPDQACSLTLLMATGGNSNTTLLAAQGGPAEQ